MLNKFMKWETEELDTHVKFWQMKMKGMPIITSFSIKFVGWAKKRQRRAHQIQAHWWARCALPTLHDIF